LYSCCIGVVNLTFSNNKWLGPTPYHPQGDS
jgi:hypothetical protein